MTDRERLARDAFPVEVYAPDLRAAPFRCRAFITTTRVILWATDVGPDGREGVPYCVVDVEHGAIVDRDRGSLFGQLRFDTAAGPVHVTPGHGCGCGSPLKGLDPPVAW